MRGFAGNSQTTEWQVSATTHNRCSDVVVAACDVLRASCRVPPDALFCPGVRNKSGATDLEEGFYSIYRFSTVYAWITPYSAPLMRGCRLFFAPLMRKPRTDYAWVTSDILSGAPIMRG